MSGTRIVRCDPQHGSAPGAPSGTGPASARCYNLPVSRGHFVTFEGIEGSGKTTQLQLVAEHLRRCGVAVVTTREPGGTPLGERIRDLLLDPRLTPTPAAELFLLEAARAQLVAAVIGPALREGAFVLADRFADSSLAYQGAARSLGVEMVARLNAIACGAVVPDRTLVFDLDVGIALSRARSRASTTATNRRFEDEEVAFHRAVAHAYLELARRDPGRLRIVDAAGTREDVFNRTLASLDGVLP
ncbi:MAG TPA: dTMP kinase [Thermoanaerobaculaceae bacterium]|nr:dTMP kinase [Thermoanaerobaculaceae bacterium]